MSSDWLHRTRREPLLQFVVLGTAVVLLHALVVRPATTRHIVLSAAEVDGLQHDYQRRNGRPPTAAEAAGVIQRFVDDEVLYREALALGLDRGDIIVRRRLVQKMEFLLDDQDRQPPDDAQLERFRQAHSDAYASPARVSFEQVFAAADRRADARADAARWRDALRGSTDPGTLGDPFVHGRLFTRRTQRDIAGLFGPQFAAAVMQLPIGTWSAPLPSSYGFHLVRVTQRVAASQPPLAEIRPAVVRDWQEADTAQRRRRAIDRLRARYRIDVAAPHDAGMAQAMELPQ